MLLMTYSAVLPPVTTLLQPSTALLLCLLYSGDQQGFFPRFHWLVKAYRQKLEATAVLTYCCQVLINLALLSVIL